MALDCGATFAKYLLCLFNFIFFAAGGMVLALSIWLAVDNTSFLLLTRITENTSLQEYNQPSVMDYGAYVLIAAGGLVFLIGFLGCCGAAMESRALLTMYGLMVIVIFLLEVTAGVLAGIYRAEAEEELQNFLKHTLKNYYSTESTANSVTVAWNALMAELHCCGVNNFTDFEQAQRWQENKTSDTVVLPTACCILTGEPTKFKPADPTCTSQPNTSKSYYLTGCYGRLMQWMYDHVNTIMGIGIGVGVTELLAMLFAFCLCNSFGTKIK
ncbi:tetraspanin-1-like isoform X3 [Oratosquilla oratoria]|uniref:tetraspanin-1-like isoform X3 n=1 Tax=Oratosquilla oratoria TaxID=337810 RepID=UPI003F772394